MIFQNTGPSGGRLAWLLGTSVKMPYRNEERHTQWNKEVIRERTIPNINYGCASHLIPDDCYNKYAELSRDKTHCFKIFKAAGLPYPKLIDPENYDLPFLGRINSSSKGQGITKYNRVEDIKKYDRNDFYVEFIQGISEHRVYVWENEIVAETNKDISKNIHSFIRNFNNGSKLIPGFIQHRKRLDILNASIEAVQRVGLDYGAVDLIIDRYDNYYILEVNSSPCLAKIWGCFFAYHLNRKFNLNIKFEWTVNMRKLTVEKVPEKYFFGRQ